MRYVIVICVITGIVVFDAAENDGHMLAVVLGTLRSLMRMVGVDA